MKRFLLTTVCTACFFAVVPARADLPVIDTSALAQWAKELQQQYQQIQTAVSTLTQAEQQVRDIEDIPQNLEGQVAGLLQVAVQNPLQNITGNLSALFNGSGTGTCAGSAGLLAMNQYQTATGGDFLGSAINGTASVTAGLQACTQQMMQATQTRLNEMPDLLNQVQACKDVACATALSDRIQLETATINAQQQQAQLVMMQGQMQRWTTEDQTMQLMRNNEEVLINETGGNGALGTGTSGTALQPTTTAPVFDAGTFDVGG